jgi:hypothetical protein
MQFLSRLESRSHQFDEKNIGNGIEFFPIKEP